jgi:L-alanine-DL-glutamate epimerase-like enolase superfamily enzyme
MERVPPTIAAIETTRVELRPSPKLVVRGARGTHDHSEFVLVRVTTREGHLGYGEVSATPYWSGEDASTAEHFIRDLLVPALVGQPLEPIAALSTRIDKALAGNPFTKAGVNMALWDALGRALGLPVTTLLGGPFRTSVPTKISLSRDGDDLADCLEAARMRGFRSFKVKVGVDVDADVARFALARELAGADTFIGADANGGWRRDEAEKAITQLRPYRPAFIEQPVAPDDVEGMRSLRGRGVPIVADESIYSLGDLARAVRAEACDVVNVYVGKSGGLERAVLAARTAATFGVGAIIGSNGEFGVGAAAQIHVACACEMLGPFPSDIIGHHYYDDDILVQRVPIDGVEAHLPEGPGLGVRLDESIEAMFS